jgi:hypothetical protein
VNTRIPYQGGSQQAFQFGGPLFNSLGLSYSFAIACRRLSSEAVFLGLLRPLFAFRCAARSATARCR